MKKNIFYGIGLMAILPLLATSAYSTTECSNDVCCCQWDKDKNPSCYATSSVSDCNQDTLPSSCYNWCGIQGEDKCTSDESCSAGDSDE